MTDVLAPPSAGRISRQRRLTAVAIDGAPLVLALVITTLVATGWLLARTQAGRLEVRDTDARLAASLVLAAPPAWLAWLAPGVARGATLGQRRAGLLVHGSATARVARFALHPLALPLWLWLALVALAGGAPSLGAATGLVAAFALLLALGSAALWATSPTSRALHDRLAGTRLVPAVPSEPRP